MFEYKFVKIELKARWFNLKPKEDYKEIVEQHAREGWRFVQLFAPGIKGYGVASYYELIFERENR